MSNFEAEIGRRIQSEGELKEIVVGRIDLGRMETNEIDRVAVEASILKVKDGDSVLFIPGFRESSWMGAGMALPDIGRMELDNRQKERLQWATGLKLPPLAAVHLALNTDEDLEDYGPVGNKGPAYLIGVYGQPGELKSKTIAVLASIWGRAQEIEVETAGFDSHSARGVKAYEEKLEVEHLKLGRELEPGEMIEALKKVEVPGKAERRSLKETLDNYVNSFKAGKRMDICLVDLPGLGEGRKMDSYDVLAVFGLVTMVAERGRDEESTLMGYLNDLRGDGGMVLYELMATDAQRIEVFGELVREKCLTGLE